MRALSATVGIALVGRLLADGLAYGERRAGLVSEGHRDQPLYKGGP
jgi:hypothetical protein